MNFWKNEFGGMAGYTIMTGLVLVGAIAAVGTVGDETSVLFGEVNAKLSPIVGVQCAEGMHAENGDCASNFRTLTPNEFDTVEQVWIEPKGWTNVQKTSMGDRGEGSVTYYSWQNDTWNEDSFVCNGENHEEDGACVSNFQFMDVENGALYATWNGTEYEATSYSCDPGYVGEGMACVPDTGKWVKIDEKMFMGGGSNPYTGVRNDDLVAEGSQCSPVGDRVYAQTYGGGIQVYKLFECQP